MLTRMTDEDWERVVQVFRAVRSRRGDKGRNDRRFLEALHYFTLHNINWRALPAEFGNWNSVWKRFWRLSRAGVFEAFFDALAATSRTAHLVQMLDSTIVRAHVSAAGAKGGQSGQALGRSRGGFSSKIHLKADLDGQPLAFHLTEGEASDSPQFEILLDLGPDITPRAAVGDKGYDSKANRSAARERSICPVIPFRSSTKNRPDTAHHSAYCLGFARIAYPWHPLYGRRLRVGQRTTRRAADFLLVEERIGVLRELPAWMCDEAACAAMTPGPPTVSIAALNDLTLVLADLTAKPPSPSSSSSPVTLESPYETSGTTQPHPTHVAPRARAGTASPDDRGADAPAGAGRPSPRGPRSADPKPTDQSRNDGGRR